MIVVCHPSPPYLNDKKLELYAHGDSNHGCWLQTYICTHLANITNMSMCFILYTQHK